MRERRWRSFSASAKATPCRWHGEVSRIILLGPMVLSNGHTRVGARGPYSKPLRRSREVRDEKLGASLKSSSHLHQGVQDRGGLHGRHAVRWMRRPGDRSVHSQHEILRIRASLATPSRCQGRLPQPIRNRPSSVQPSRSYLALALESDPTPVSSSYLVE